MSTNRKKLVCPKCGTEMPSFANFCKQCGTALDKEQNINTTSDESQIDIVSGCFGMIVICLLLSVGWYIWSSINSTDSSTYTNTTQQYIKTSGYSSISFNDCDDLAVYLSSHRFVNSNGLTLVFEKKGVYFLMGEKMCDVKGFLEGQWLGTGPVSVDYWNPQEGIIMLSRANSTTQLVVNVNGSHYVSDASGDRYYEQ